MDALKLAGNFMRRHFDDCTKSGYYSGIAMFQEFLREYPLKDDEWTLLVIHAAGIICERPGSTSFPDEQVTPQLGGAQDPVQALAGHKRTSNH